MKKVIFALGMMTAVSGSASTQIAPTIVTCRSSEGYKYHRFEYRAYKKVQGWLQIDETKITDKTVAFSVTDWDDKTITLSGDTTIKGQTIGKKYTIGMDLVKMKKADLEDTTLKDELTGDVIKFNCIPLD